MIKLRDALQPEHVQLSLACENPEQAIARTAELLRNDERIANWAEFVRELRAHPPCRVAESADFGICVPHARTDAVTSMAMSAARLTEPLKFPDCPKPIRYIFCLGIPQAMAADYLRIAGALMRIFADPETENVLAATKSREEFIRALERLEAKI